MMIILFAMQFILSFVCFFVGAMFAHDALRTEPVFDRPEMAIAAYWGVVAAVLAASAGVTLQAIG